MALHGFDAPDVLRGFNASVVHALFSEAGEDHPSSPRRLVLNIERGARLGLRVYHSSFFRRGCRGARTAQPP